MFRTLIKKFLRDRRGATAVALAIMTVPLLISAGAAVDFARVLAAHTLLQAAVDGSALAGAGEWVSSESSSDANNVATSEFSNTGFQLPFLSSTPTLTVSLYCSGAASSQQCGQSVAYSTTFDPTCQTGAEYCVVVSATVKVTNSLLHYFIPSELLTASAAASTAFGSQQQASTARNGLYQITAGDTEYTTANTGGSYLVLSSSGGISSVQGGGSITANSTTPFYFQFVDFAGGQTANAQMDTTHYTTNICVSTSAPPSTYTLSPNLGCYPNGYVATTAGTTCKRHQVNCTPALPTSTVLYGECPARNLYGAIYQTSNYNLGAPASDSADTVSSLYEISGEPPTYGTNHIITPFITTYDIHEGSYYVYAECPNYPTAGTSINAPVSSTFTDAGGDSTFAGMNVFSTWYPTGLANDLVFANNTPPSDGVSAGGSNEVWPPALGGCSPATNATDGGITPISGDPWWNWNSSPAFTTSPGNYCSALQTPNYSNCALLIQPLGQNVPTEVVNNVTEALLPDYYLMIESANGTVLALDPIWDNSGAQSSGTFTDRYPGTIVSGLGGFDKNITVNGTAVTDNDPAGYVPLGATRSYPYVGPALSANGQTASTVVIEQPAETNTDTFDDDLPAQTSHQCYDPTAATKSSAISPIYSNVPGYYANGLPVDPIANPQLGAVYCDTDPPNTYALYWNDMGGFENDDLGYWNTIDLFTCSTPPNTNADAGAPEL